MGSALTMAKAIKNCVEKVGIHLEEALRMASLYPAKVVSLDKQYGRIRKDYATDFVILHDAVNVVGTPCI